MFLSKSDLRDGIIALPVIFLVMIVVYLAIGKEIDIYSLWYKESFLKSLNLYIGVATTLHLGIFFLTQALGAFGRSGRSGKS